MSAYDVGPGEAEALVADGWQLLDVRTQMEWDDGHVPDAVHIPMDQVVARLDEIGDRVVCLCAVGGRSARVAAYLDAQGREVVNLDGGMQAWAAEGRDVTASGA